MRDINKATITDAVISSVANSDDPRTQEILTAVIRHLHDFVKEVNLTSEEWQTAMDLFLKASEISDDVRNEFIMFSDTLGVSSLVDLMADEFGESTDASLLGPFYVEGAPELGYGANMIKENDGIRTIVQGKVTDLDGTPLPGAVLDVWQNAANGLYQVYDDSQDDDNLRCRTVTNDAGEYLFATIKPVPYPVPDDGPVGDMLRATNRHPMRTSHIHFKITKNGFRTLVTEVFPDDDPYLDEDAVFGVREPLIAAFKEAPESETPAVPGVEVPYCNVKFDFRLAPE